MRKQCNMGAFDSCQSYRAHSALSNGKKRTKPLLHAMLAFLSLGMCAEAACIVYHVHQELLIAYALSYTFSPCHIRPFGGADTPHYCPSTEAGSQRAAASDR